MSEEFGLLDTSVIIDLNEIPQEELPLQILVSSLTIAELVAGVSNKLSDGVRAIRLGSINSLRTSEGVIPFDDECAMKYASVAAAVVSFGRKPRGKRAVDYLIATTAAHLGIPLYTRNPKDFEGLDGIVEIVSV
jgi:predicted nucleic acid-binding protein